MDENGAFRRSRKWRNVFFVTILLRTWFSISPSYIHPDEHFQGPEVVADTVFGWATKKTWEFDSVLPARSYVPLIFTYALPMQFMSGLHETISPLTVYYLLRLGFAIWTWVFTDMAIDRLTNSKPEKIRGMLFVATSYVTWTYQSHTFSNSVETVLLLWCLVIIHEFGVKKLTFTQRIFDATMLGAFVGFGTFNRITFPAFLLLPSIRLIPHFKKYPMTLVSLLFSGLATTSLIIWMDSIHYKSDSAVITPLNNLLYNMNTSNLADHGLHPRFTHALVNLPQLIGPGLILLFSKKNFKSICFQSAVSGLVVLSLVPHQEPRFLLPLVPLLCLVFDTDWLSQRALNGFFLVWVLFNLSLGVLMGSLHQGGVVPAQSYIGEHLAKDGSSFIWWKTYSPPIWLLGRHYDLVTSLDPLPFGSDSNRYAPIYAHLRSDAYLEDFKNTTVIDMMGCSYEMLKEAMDAVSHASAGSSSKLRRTYLVAPVAAFNKNLRLKAIEASTDSGRSAVAKRSAARDVGYQLAQVWHTKVHLSMESLDFSDFGTFYPGLAVWEIQSL